jgi:hypothetical protein
VITVTAYGSDELVVLVACVGLLLGLDPEEAELKYQVNPF